MNILPKVPPTATHSFCVGSNAAKVFRQVSGVGSISSRSTVMAAICQTVIQKRKTPNRVSKDFNLLWWFGAVILEEIRQFFDLIIV